MNKLCRLFYLYSKYIVNYGFYLYFLIYIIGKLNHRHILYSYILFIFLGLFLGYRLAIRSIDYNRK